MFSKILVGVLAFAASFIIQWYGNFTGKLPNKGTYLGLNYDSVFVKSVVTQFEYLWVLIIINILFAFVLKEKTSFIALAGVFLVIVGTVCVVAHKEILELVKK